MRKEVLGLLACVAVGSQAFAQYPPGNYGPAPGEPMPIQGGMYPSAAFGAYPSPFPSYSPPNWQEVPVPASPPYGMPYAAPQPLPYPPSGPMPMPGYPPPPSGPMYAPPPSPFGPLPGGPLGAPGIPTSQGKPPSAPPGTPPWQAPPPNPSLRDSKSPASGAPSSGPPAPSEPYLFSQPAGSGHPEPYFQQVDPWQAVRGSRIYGFLDYLYWGTNRQSLPSITTLPGVDPASQIGGLANDPRSGVRATFGEWITPMKNLAWEGSYFYLGDQTESSALVLPGSAPNVSTLPVFFGINSQSSQVIVASHLWGAETNLRYQFCCFKTDCVQWFIDVLGGFRYLDLSEGVGIQTGSQFAEAPVLLSGATVNATDNFFTHNNFYGGQLGAETNIYVWRFNVNLYGKVGLGDNLETANISGFTTVVSPTANQLLSGGFLTAPSNIGHHTQNVFAVVPEAGINLGFRVCHYCELGVGYTFLYFSKVLRPADQISPVPGGTVLPPALGGAAAQPTFNFQQSHFFADGVNARIMFIF